TNPDAPACKIRGKPDVMGYHTAKEIPNYWTYAQNFVLQDHMFEPVNSWSLPAHIYMLSEWMANCSGPNPATCVDTTEIPYVVFGQGDYQYTTPYSWTDLTYLLHQ